MKKKIALLLVAAMTVASLVACGNSAEDAPAAAPAEEATEAPAEETEAPAEETTEAEAPAEAGSVAVFYYTYGDTYISASAFSFCKIIAEISWGEYLLSAMFLFLSVPMSLLIEEIVLSALVTA